MKGELSCHKVMEQDRKEKGQARAEAWGLAAREKEKVAAKGPAGGKEKAVVRGKVKVVAKRKAVRTISRILSRQGA